MLGVSCWELKVKSKSFIIFLIRAESISIKIQLQSNIESASGSSWDSFFRLSFNLRTFVFFGRLYLPFSIRSSLFRLIEVFLLFIWLPVGRILDFFLRLLFFRDAAKVSFRPLWFLSFLGVFCKRNYFFDLCEGFIDLLFLQYLYYLFF